MGLTSRPSKKIDFSKIDNIQNEFFDDQISNDVKGIKEDRDFDSTKKAVKKKPPAKFKPSDEIKSPAGKTRKSQTTENDLKEKSRRFEDDPDQIKETAPENPTIADLLATAKIEGVRHVSRPFTIPRSLTIDLNRLKSKFRTRDLQYTQNELMDKMIKESLEIITADNYFSLRERAFKFVKSPEQCSRRSVTLTEEAVSEMAELKANLALALNRRTSSDEIFTTLLAVAFSSLYEGGLL